MCSVALQNATSTGPYTPTLNNFVLDIPDDEWDPDGTSTQVTILSGDLQFETNPYICLLYTSPSPRDRQKSRMPSSA